MNSQYRGTRGSWCSKIRATAVCMNRCCFPFFQGKAVREQKLNSGLTNNFSITSGYQVSSLSKLTPLLVFTSSLSLLSIQASMSFSPTSSHPCITVQNLHLSHTLWFSSAPSSPSLFSPHKTLSYS